MLSRREWLCGRFFMEIGDSIHIIWGVLDTYLIFLFFFSWHRKSFAHHFVQFYRLTMRTDTVLSISRGSVECTFKPIRPWGGTPTRAMPHGGIQNEEVMASKPYGIKEDIDETLNMDTEDLYLDMKERQIDFVSPATFNSKASYLPYRRYLVDWMSDVGEQCRLHNSTVHVAVLYLDKIFRSSDLPRGQWQLLATACLSLASKYEEAEEHCPTIPSLLSLTKLDHAGHTPLSFREGELCVLQRLSWRLRAVPAIHIVGYYLSKGVCFEDDTWQGRGLIEKIPRYLKKYADFFCNLCLQENTFNHYLPSILGAAITKASRVSLNISPPWRHELTLLTGYEEAEIDECFQHVWSYYEEQFPGHGSRSISPRSVTNATDVYP